MNNYVKKIQQFVLENFPDVNTKVGSALYFLLVLPAAQIYQYVQSLIDALGKSIAINTATNKVSLLSNFGIPSVVGSNGTGTLQLKLNPTQVSYVFPEGTTFVNANDDKLILRTSQYFLSRDATTIYLDVETYDQTNKIFYPGESFTPSLYGSLIESCVVSSQIGGGSIPESVSDWQTRIYKNLTRNVMTTQGLLNALQIAYPSLVDIKVEKTTIYIKSPLSLKTVHLDSPYTIRDNISKVISSSEIVRSWEVTNKGTVDEMNHFTFDGPTDLQYWCPYLVSDVQAYINDTGLFPIGVSFKIKQATEYFVSGEIVGQGDLETVKQYFLSYPISNFRMSDFITTCNLASYKLPITLYFNDVPVVDEFTEEFSSLYYWDIQIRRY